MRADGTEFPVELVVTRPEVGRRPPAVFYGYLRDLTARYVAETALHRLADEQAALRRVATAVAAESESARLFTLVSEEVGRLLEARTAHMFRFDSDGRRGRSSAAGRCGPSTCCRSGRGCRSTATRPRRACGARGGRRGWTPTPGRGRAGGDAARVRRAGRGGRAGLPRRVAVGRRDRLHDGPGSRSPRTPSSGSPTSPSWPPRRWPTPRPARSWRRRAPGSSPPATPSAGGWSATCTTARSSGSCRWR